MRGEQCNRLRSDRSGGDAGYVIALSALLMIPLMVVTAFSVDLGNWYSRAAEIQRTADSAALAAVVWMPEFTAAEAVAKADLLKNGIDADSTTDEWDVVIEKDPSNPLRRVIVTITENDVPLFFAGVVLDDVDIARSATSEFIDPVPLGSPRNYLGTGNLLDVGGSAPTENVWMSMNGECNQSDNGDLISAFRHATASNCTSVPSNSYYDGGGYDYYIEVPATRTTPIDVWTYEPYVTPSREFPSMDLPGNPNFFTEINVYQADGTIFDDSDNPHACGFRFSGPTAASMTIQSVDQNGVPSPTARTFTDLRAQSATYDTSSGWASSYPNLATDRKNRWFRLCTIPAATSSLPAGATEKWLMNVSHSGVANTNYRYENNHGFVAARQGASTTLFCDSRTEAGCPKIFGKDWVSFFVSCPPNSTGSPTGCQSTSTSNAEFFLAEIDSVHEGKKLKVTVYDADENATTLRLRRPTGTDSWTDVGFTWTCEVARTGGSCGSGGSTTSLNLRNASNNPRFNDGIVTLEFDLTGYSPPADNQWWRVAYTFANEPTDHTTWAVRVVGDPVRIVD